MGRAQNLECEARYREENQKAKVSYPDLVFPDWLKRKNSEDEKIAAMHKSKLDLTPS